MQIGHNNYIYINKGLINVMLYFFFIVPKPPKVDFSRVPKEVILKVGERLQLDIPFVGKIRKAILSLSLFF